MPFRDTAHPVLTEPRSDRGFPQCYGPRRAVGAGGRIRRLRRADVHVLPFGARPVIVAGCSARRGLCTAVPDARARLLPGTGCTLVTAGRRGISPTNAMHIRCRRQLLLTVPAQVDMTTELVLDYGADRSSAVSTAKASVCCCRVSSPCARTSASSSLYVLCIHWLLLSTAGAGGSGIRGQWFRLQALPQPEALVSV
jgi:hypothetical protein